MKRLLAFLTLISLAVMPAMAMTEERAQALARQADARANKARQVWAYPDREGAWVFYATAFNEGSATFEGGFLYVTEARTARLGSFNKSVLDWDFCACDPAVFTSTTMTGGVRRLYAAALVDGVPTRLQNLGALTSLHAEYGCLLGSTARSAEDSIDYIFLGVKDGALVEIGAMAVGEDVVRRIEGMAEIIETLRQGGMDNSGGLIIGEYLYRNAAPGRFRDSRGVPRGSLTLNATRDGAPCHVNIFLDENGAAVPQRGWEDEIIVWDGAAPAAHDAGFEVVDTVGE